MKRVILVVTDTEEETYDSLVRWATKEGYNFDGLLVDMTRYKAYFFKNVRR
jgi:hypothetical protein